MPNTTAVSSPRLPFPFPRPHEAPRRSPHAIGGPFVTYSHALVLSYTFLMHIFMHPGCTPMFPKCTPRVPHLHPSYTHTHPSDAPHMHPSTGPCLQVPLGSVTPLAVVQPTAQSVVLLLDHKLKDQERILVHPLTNTSTVAIPSEGLEAFLK